MKVHLEAVCGDEFGTTITHKQIARGITYMYNNNMIKPQCHIGIKVCATCVFLFLHKKLTLYLHIKS